MLFNKEISGLSIGNEEITTLMGFNFSDLRFGKLQPYILADERRVKALIGGIYATAQGRYNHGDYSPNLNAENKLDQLVHRIQAAHVFKAYLDFAKNNDLSHGNSGRRIMVGTEEKPAFEWMIEADNRALLRKAYDALDALLFFLEENAAESDFAPWKNSEERKRLRGYLVANVTAFEAVFPIDTSMRFFMLVRPFMADVEKRYILPVMGATRYQALIDKLANGTELQSGDKQLLALASPPVVYYTLEQAMFKLADEEMPETILRTYFPDSSNRKNYDKLKKDQRVVYRSEGDRLMLDLEEHIRMLDSVDNDFQVLPANDPDNKFFQA